jgi:hypothetical protein
MTTKTWAVQVRLDEDGDDTRAEAVLTMENKTEIRGQGWSRRNPRDEADPRIGDELATARALSELTHQLLGQAASDIEAHTHEPVRSLQL